MIGLHYWASVVSNLAEEQLSRHLKGPIKKPLINQSN